MNTFYKKVIDQVSNIQVVDTEEWTLKDLIAEGKVEVLVKHYLDTILDSVYVYRQNGKVVNWHIPAQLHLLILNSKIENCSVESLFLNVGPSSEVKSRIIMEEVLQALMPKLGGIDKASILDLQRNLLIEARKLIAGRKRAQLCFAVSHAEKILSYKQPLFAGASELGEDAICLWIEKMLCFKVPTAAATLEDWLIQRGFKHSTERGIKLRLLWIDWMLKQLENNTAQEMTHKLEVARRGNEQR